MMPDLTEDEKARIELEVRRILSSEEVKIRQTLSNEAAGYRDFLQKQFKQVTVGITALAAVGVGLFVWFFSDSVSKTQSQLEATIDAKIIDYRIVESFRERVNEIVQIAANSDRTSDIISDQVNEQANIVVNEIADQVIRDAVQSELAKVEGLDVDALLQRAALPAGALVAFTNASNCPDGWTNYEPVSGRFILGVGGNYSIGQTGGEEKHTLLISELPTHSHDYRTTDNGPLHDNPHNFIGGAGRFGQVGTKQTGSIGGGQPHNNMPPYIALKFCSKL